MRANIARITRWMRRDRPSRKDLWRALGAGFISSSVSVGLLVGALALLVESATRPGLRAVAVVLVLIELFAFLRSPLRFLERMSSHQLGYAAVTTWRRWLVTVVGAFDFSTWRRYAAGDLLERALDDTDELQNLWLRFFVPFADTLALFVTIDIVVFVLPPFAHWWAVSTLFFAIECAGVAALAWCVSLEYTSDRSLRLARAHYRALVVELGGAAPELALLNRLDIVTNRLGDAARDLERAEQRRNRLQRRSSIVVAGAGLLGIASVALHPPTSAVWLVCGAALALANVELFATIRWSLRAAIDVAGGGERLEALDAATVHGDQPWPDVPTLELRQVVIDEANRPLLANASLVIPYGSRVAITGDSGVGKSTLLRTVARLDAVSDGTIYIGTTPLESLDEDSLRRHLAYLPSEPGLTSGYLTDVIRLGRETSRDQLRDLEELGLSGETATRFGALSRGERVRVALARAMVTSPEVYLLDEPTAGLGRDETLLVLSTLAATGATVLVATHDEDVIEWCTQVVRLHDHELEAIR
jgi:ATP-binding cassette subfamily C protein CydC